MIKLLVLASYSTLLSAGIVLMVLKLTAIITCSWLMVAVPFLVAMAFLALCGILFLI